MFAIMLAFKHANMHHVCMRSSRQVYNRSGLLMKFAKLYVLGELGLDPKPFARTADSAWVGFADRLLQPGMRQRMRLSKSSGRKAIRSK
jgi:hypothetical protein